MGIFYFDKKRYKRSNIQRDNGKQKVENPKTAISRKK